MDNNVVAAMIEANKDGVVVQKGGFFVKILK